MKHPLLTFGGYLLSVVTVQFSLAGDVVPERQMIVPELLHLRSGTEREWSEFPEIPGGQRLDIAFTSNANTVEHTLLMRQQDVKETWQVKMNGKKLGELVRDENDMLVTAGEGIELPIATDHNKHIDYEEPAARLGVRQFFTPVIGNEVTTPRGHFNVFPIAAGARIVDNRQTDWTLLFDEIHSMSMMPFPASSKDR